MYFRLGPSLTSALRHSLAVLALSFYSTIYAFMKMSFVVRELSEFPENIGQKVVASVRYPPQEIADVVVTELELWEVEVNVGGWWKWFTWSYWRSVFNMKPDYNIVLHQRDLRSEGETKSSVAFVLHECEDGEWAQSAFKAIHDLLEPLVDDCALMLTNGLLKELILPSPRAPEQLVFDLVEIMEKKPEVHDNWKEVLHAVVEPALQVDGGEGIQLLRYPGVNLGISNPVEDIDVSHPNESARGIRKLMDCVATHGAAQDMKQIIDRVGAKLGRQETQSLLKQRNTQGKTLLHIAFENNNQDVVKELMRSDSSLLTSIDSDASTPLHLAAQQDANECIFVAWHLSPVNEEPSCPVRIDFMDAMNMRNGKGFTPLMLAVRRGYLSSAMSLFISGANPDVHHPMTWNTALHYAAEVGNPSLVKLLIVFGADMKATNKARMTPLGVTCASSQPNSAACTQILEETLELLDEANRKFSDTFEPSPIPKDSMFLLSLDGGGVRVFVMVQILIALRERMQHLQPDCCTLRFYFDYIAGTSAGCVCALGLSHLNIAPDEARSAVMFFSEKLYSLTPTYPDEVMEACFTAVFSKDLKLGDVDKPRVIMPTVIGDRSPPVLHLMCNYGEARDGEEIHARERKVWEVARASSSAPVYAAPFEGRFIDGGLMANNPTLVAMTEIFEQAEREEKDIKIGLVVSIGNGYPTSTEGRDVTIHIPHLHNMLSTLFDIKGAVSRLFNLFNAFIAQTTQSDGYEVKKAQAWCKTISTRYFRISPQLSKRYKIVESDRAVLTDIMYEGHICALRNAKEIDAIAKLLLARGPSR